MGGKFGWFGLKCWMGDEDVSFFFCTKIVLEIF